jgi:hypothetical protein
MSADPESPAMRVLDLNLNFFLDDVAYNREASGDRLSDDYTPWDEVAVRDFLEQRCGLRKEGRIPGRLVTHHHEAFFFWKELIDGGALTVPFDVVHVDAHSDLGLGDAGYLYLMTDVLHRPVVERVNLQVGRHRLNAANYLAFAAGCRWLRRLTFVVNPASRDDLPYFHFRDFDTSSPCLQLKACNLAAIDAFFAGRYSAPFVPEPDIPFEKVLPNDFSDTEGFDFVVLCHSPGFTPAASDRLIPIIAEYLRIPIIAEYHRQIEAEKPAGP